MKMVSPTGSCQSSNPILRLQDNLRDPAILVLPGGYRLFFTLFRPGEWGDPMNWRIGSCTTADFNSFSPVDEITSYRFASPYDPVKWAGRWVMAFQSYPGRPSELHFSTSSDGNSWGPPVPFLREIVDLPWNQGRRAIDPSLVVEDGHLYCFFVGNAPNSHNPKAVNALGLASTTDPDLRSWNIITLDRPLFEPHRRGWDGIENLQIIRASTGEWWMYLSEGIREQHVVRYRADHLPGPWLREAELSFPPAAWMDHRHGAPCVWLRGETFLMLLMGEENEAHRSSLGLFSSADGLNWTPAENVLTP